MSEDKIAWTLELIRKLQYWQIGDFSRLNAIKNALENGRIVYESDKKYLREKFEELKKFESDRPSEIKNESVEPQPMTLTKESETDESLKILKNRLAKGEITLDEFNSLKMALVDTDSDSVKDLTNQINSMTKHIEKISKEQNENLLIQTKGKSESTTLILSLVLGLIGLPGIGHIYVDKWGKGVAILAISLILFWAGIATLGMGFGYFLLVIYLVIFIWQIFDARKECREYNYNLTPEGVRIKLVKDLYYDEKYEKSLTACKDILKGSPREADALWYMALSLKKLGKYSEAKHVFELILEEFPNHDPTKEEIKEINKKIIKQNKKQNYEFSL